MSTCVLVTLWRHSYVLRRPNTKILFPRSPLHTSTITANIFEPLPREELVTKFKSRLRDRDFLPGSSGAGFPEFLAEPRDSFPLGVRVNNLNHSSLAELTTMCMEYMEENHSSNPAILFRGLPAKTAEDFSIIAQAIPRQRFIERGMTGNRGPVDKNAGTYTTSDHPNPFSIEIHNELAYNKIFPSKVFFFCINEPADGCGGETPLGRTTEITSKLDPKVLQKFEEKQIRYLRYLPDESPGDDFYWMTWRYLFRTDNRKDVEKQAEERGYSVRWNESGDLYMWQIRSAFITHPETGERLWFNQAHSHNRSYHKSLPTFINAEIPDEKFPNHSFYGDGSEIEPEVLQHIRATSWACAVGFQWRSGDLLALNNVDAQHGRIGFTGDRKLIAYLTH